MQPALRQVSEPALHSFQNYCVQSLSVHPHKSVPPALMHSPSITKRCCLTGRSTGPIAAGRHLGYKSLAQTPARRNRPVSLYVRHHPENAANFVNSARRDASPHKNGPHVELFAKHILSREYPARNYLTHQTVLSHCIHTIRSAA